jgi:UV DNA damage endonuclease
MISAAPSLRLGLCCQFVDAPIRFRAATHRYVMTLAPVARRAYLSSVARANAIALLHAVERCHELGIGAFRITSQVLPLATHPESGYSLETLDDGDVIARAYAAAGAHARLRGVRLSFHPDQFVVLNSVREDVVDSSLRELELQGELAELVGADTVCLHGGGAVDGKPAALDRLTRALGRLSARARAPLALENDDRVFSPADLLPLCEREGVPFVYDVHHHRCLADGLTVGEASARAVTTWRTREPWMHISSPRAGWNGGDARPHADYVDPADFPEEWLHVAATTGLTVDVEAKAKERAVLALAGALAARTPAERVA